MFPFSYFSPFYCNATHKAESHMHEVIFGLVVVCETHLFSGQVSVLHFEFF